MNAALDRRAREHFEALDEPGKRAAIHWLKSIGFSDHGIASATRLAVEEIRRILSEPES